MFSSTANNTRDNDSDMFTAPSAAPAPSTPTSSSSTVHESSAERDKSSVILSGYLTRRGDYIHKWSRYFILKANGLLFYFPSHEQLDRPSGVFIVHCRDSSTHVSDENSSSGSNLRPHVFSIHCKKVNTYFPSFILPIAMIGVDDDDDDDCINYY